MSESTVTFSAAYQCLREQRYRLYRMLARHKRIMLSHASAPEYNDAFDSESWKWSALMWLDSTAHASLPAELRVFVLLNGWVAPLALEHNPLLVYWLMKDVWSAGSLQLERASASGPKSIDAEVAVWGGGLIAVGEGFCGLDHHRLFHVALCDGLYTTPLLDEDEDHDSDGGRGSCDPTEINPTKQVATSMKRSLVDVLRERFEWVVEVRVLDKVL